MRVCVRWLVVGSRSSRSHPTTIIVHKITYNSTHWIEYSIKGEEKRQQNKRAREIIEWENATQFKKKNSNHLHLIKLLVALRPLHFFFVVHSQNGPMRPDSRGVSVSVWYNTLLRLVRLVHRSGDVVSSLSPH